MSGPNNENIDGLFAGLPAEYQQVLISELQYQFIYLLVAEWIHFTLFGIILPTIKPTVYTFWGL